MKIAQIVEQYLATADWADADDSFDPTSGWSVQAREQATIECGQFFQKAISADYLVDIEDATDIGHNFWLSRNGHGIGFQDRDFKYGKELDELAKTFGSRNLYEIDGEIYFDI